MLQNRKSAKKCRLKKKAEFGYMKNDVIKLQEENKILKEKVYLIWIQYYIDQWNHDNALLEDGRDFKLVTQVWTSLTSVACFPIINAKLANLAYINRCPISCYESFQSQSFNDSLLKFFRIEWTECRSFFNCTALFLFFTHALKSVALNSTEFRPNEIRNRNSSSKRFSFCLGQWIE